MSRLPPPSSLASAAFLGNAAMPLPPEEIFHEAVFYSNARKLTDVFTQWRENRPDVPGIVRGLLQNDRFPSFSSRIEKIIMAAAELAEEENGNPYHGNSHFLETFALTALLGYRAFKASQISKSTFGQVLAASLVHDYKHDGGTNDKKQYRLEKLSVESAKPHLQRAGATPDDIDVIRAIVLATDVSKNFGDSEALSPAESVKKYIRRGKSANLFKELRILKRGDLAQAALILHDADIGGSLLSLDFCIKGGRLLAQELNQDYTSGFSIFFLDKICNRTLSSKAGREIIQPLMNDILKHFCLLKAGSAPRPAI